MKKYLFIILLSLPTVFSGCSSGYEDVKLIKVKDVTYQEFKGNMLRIAVTATINNPNRFNVKIKNANMELFLNDRVIGAVTQVEQIELIGRKQKDYKVLISIELKDIIGNMYRLLMNDTKNLSLSGSIQVKSFLYNKTFQIDRLSFQ